MKRAKRTRLKPRNPQAVAPLLSKGGPHQLRGKKAKRARQKVQWRKELSSE